MTNSIPRYSIGTGATTFEFAIVRESAQSHGAAAYGLPARKLGTVSLMGPVRMDYAEAILFVRDAAHQLSRFIETVYEDA